MVRIASGTSLQLDFSTPLQMNNLPIVITWEGCVKKKQHTFGSNHLITLYLNVAIFKVLVI